MTKSKEASYTPRRIYVNTASSSNPGTETAAFDKMALIEVNSEPISMALFLLPPSPPSSLFVLFLLILAVLVSNDGGALKETSPPIRRELSIYMAHKLSYNPITGVGVLPSFWLNASLRLCAGSVETSSTFRRRVWPVLSTNGIVANNVASAQDVVVLPTPPFPPTKIHRNEESSTCCSVGYIDIESVFFYKYVCADVISKENKREIFLTHAKKIIKTTTAKKQNKNVIALTV